MRSTNATQILLDTLTSFLRQTPWRGPWAVGYSGGRDSVVLLWALSQLESAAQITALHVDHGWRPAAERLAELQIVEDFCRTLGVSLRHFGPPDQVVRSELEARTHRYRCFRAFASEHPGVPVFLAHHADDQAETVLMRLLRGRSWQGLAGMAPRRGAYLRPLLTLRASVLAQVATREGLRFHHDTSNADITFTRNFLRHEVFPLLTRRFPRGIEALGEFGALWSQVGPPSEVAGSWVSLDQGAEVSTDLWDRWTPLTRQAQLLGVASGLEPTVRLGRRFLEQLTMDGRTSSAEGAGWSWSRIRGRIQWKRIGPRRPANYYVVAKAGREYDLGAYRICWFATPDAENPCGGVSIPGLRADLPVVWRSAIPGMRWRSRDCSDWGKSLRRSRLAGVSSDHCALVLQGGFLKAVVHPERAQVLWSESPQEKLHKTGIFVKLLKRSDYER